VTDPDARDPREAALTLVEAASADPSLEGTARSLERLCRTLSAELGLSGVVVRLASDDTGPTVVVPQGDSSRLAELEVTAGEGPAGTARALGRPMLVSELEGASGADWPGFRLAAGEAGVVAVFAFPLVVGAVSLGTLELFARRTGRLSRGDLALVHAFAELAIESILDDGLVVTDGGLSPSLARAFDHHAEIAQAQGMVMVDLGVPLAEAMVRLRAHAFAVGEPLLTLARRVIGGYSIPEEGD
jgi:hypothetical protein